jgi:EF hand
MEEMMKSLVVLLSIVALAVFVGLGANFALAAGAGKDAKTGADKGAMTGDMGSSFNRAECDDWFKSADADKSGNLSKSEFNKDDFVSDMKEEADKGDKGTDLFSSADKNRDGNLTKNEYCTWRSSHPS